MAFRQKAEKNQPIDHNLREAKQQRGPKERKTYMDLHRQVKKTTYPEQIGSVGGGHRRGYKGRGEEERRVKKNG